MAAQSENNASLILEDDAILGSGLASTLKSLAAIPASWDLV